VRIAYAIQHHPSRAERLPALLEAVPGATVITDPEPESRASWPAARLAWMSYENGCTHQVVLEDDAVPCAHFVEAVAAAIHERPRHAIAFWANRAQVGDALALGKSWTWSGPKFNGTVCIAMPTAWVSSFVRFGDWEEAFPPGMPGRVDERLREWLALHGGKVLLSAPCLVQHGLPEDSLLWANGGRLPITRVTSHFVDDLGIDARNIDWRAGDG